MSDTVIVVQDECILVAVGKAGRPPKVQKVERIPLNGFGDPIELWKEALTEYTKTHDLGPVKLVLPSAYASGRVTQIPYATGKELVQMAEKVMEEAGSNALADYGVISANRKQGITLCCGSAEEADISKIMGFCQEIGLDVKEISVYVESYLRVIAHQKALSQKTAIYLIFEENSVTSLLYRNGVYLYSTKSSIFSEHGTLDFGTEIVRHISGILQFYTTTNSETPITDVYYAACDPDDFEVSMEGIHAMQLEAQPLKIDLSFHAAERAEDWLACIGALTKEKLKEINLYRSWSENNETGMVKSKSMVKQILYPAAVLGICAVIYAGVMVWNMAEFHKVSEIEDWINDPQVQEDYSQAQAKQKQSSQLSFDLNQVNQMKENLATYPDMTEDMIAKIEDVGGNDMSVRIESLDMGTGTLTFHAVSYKVIDIPTYIQKLDDTGLFESVNYSGYNFEDNEYSLMLTCVLKAAETGGDQ